MEQLDDLMDKLNSDKFCAVTVYDRDTSKPIFRNVTHEQIKNDYGTAEEFFEKVFADGYKKLTLQAFASPSVATGSHAGSRARRISPSSSTRTRSSAPR